MLPRSIRANQANDSPPNHGPKEVRVEAKWKGKLSGRLDPEDG